MLKYGMKRDFNNWLASLGPSAPVKSLTELRNFNLAHAAAGAIKYGQSQLDISDEMDVKQIARAMSPIAQRILSWPERRVSMRRSKTQSGCFLFPGVERIRYRGDAGVPDRDCPFGWFRTPRPYPFPMGFNAKPAPFGVSFAGTACSEPRSSNSAMRLSRRRSGGCPLRRCPSG